MSDPLEIRNAAVHYHFPAKSDLGTEVIGCELEKFAENVEKWKGLPEDKQIMKLVEVFQKHNKNGMVCLMGSLAPDFETLSAPMQKKLQQMGNEMLDWLAEKLEKGRRKKLLRFEGHAYDRALLIMTNLQSSLLLSRVLGPSVFNRISERVLKDLK